ncbi:MAG: hypothetical protein QM749_07635 [Aquabacterium sp.]
MSSFHRLSGLNGDRRQLAIVGFCAALVLIWSALVFYNGQVQNGLVIGDWLLDYRQGFVRRGLIGEMLSMLSAASHIPVTVCVSLAQAAAYGLFLFCFVNVMAERHKPFWYMLLVFSPAALIFSYFGVSEAGRKEVLHFALLSWFVWALSAHKVTWGRTLAWMAMSAAITLSHELVVFYQPYYLIAALAVSTQRREAMRAAILIALSSCVAAASVLLWAKPLDSVAFCDSLMQSGMSSTSCQGIVLWRYQSLASSIATTVEVIDMYAYVKVYALALLLMLAPVFVWLRRYEPGVVRRQLAWFVLAWAWSVPIFILAVDWGRFIQIHFMSAMIVLALRLRRQAVPREGVSVPRFRMPSARLRWVLALVCVLAPTFWRMPVCCETEIGGGFIGKASKVTASIMHVAGL